MKNKFLLLLTLFLLLFNSCNNDDDSASEFTTIRVDHYKDTSIVSFFGTLSTVLLTQTGDQIGSDAFLPNSIFIEGFNYKLGFIYDLEVKITDIPNPPADAPSVKTELLKVLSKTEVAADTEFKVRLTLNRGDGEFINWIRIEGTNYSLKNSEIQINCGNLCTELSDKINNQEQLTAIFTHGEDDVYILKELLNE